MEILEDYSSSAGTCPTFRAGEGSGISKISTGREIRDLLDLPSFLPCPFKLQSQLQHSDFSCALTGHGLWSALSRGSFWEELLPGVPVPQRRDLRLSDGSLPLQPRLHRGTVRKTHSCQPAEPGGLCYSRETSEAGRKNKESICDTVKSADFVGGMCAVSLS